MKLTKIMGKFPCSAPADAAAAASADSRVTNLFNFTVVLHSTVVQ